MDNFSVEEVSVPVLVVGAGAAGAMASITMKQHGVEPLVVSKRDHGDAHTIWARGGINAAIGTHDDEDSWEIHAADTLTEGHFINDPVAVEQVSKNMPEVIRVLREWGMDLSTTETGEIDQRYFGAQSFRRTCFAGDYTGEALLNTLISKAQELEIPYQDDVYVTKVLSDDNRVYGAIGFDMNDEKAIVFRSPVVVLAAGGLTSVYTRHSSRDMENTADGIGLAFDAGVDLMDVEFIQFHPTGMVGERYGEEWDGRLVTEAVRGEGGRLYNSNNERFMKKYSPDQMELDARDVVARAIDQEIREGRGTENNGVYLDITHKPESFIKERLPTMYERFMSLGVNIAEEPMEVSPTAHYAMGGTTFNATTGETQVNGLYTLGETTAGVHGANRLGGNSLAETVAIGRQAGTHIGTTNPSIPPKNTQPKTIKNQITDELTRVDQLLNSSSNKSPEHLIETIRQITEEHAGILRDEQTLTNGLKKLNDLKNQQQEFSVSFGDQFELYHNAQFMRLATELILRGARKRTESRGAHYRTDHPEKDPDQKHNIVYTNTPSNIQLHTNQPSQQLSKPVKDALNKNYSLDYHHLE